MWNKIRVAKKSIQSYTGWQKEQSLKALVEQTYTKHETMVYGWPLWTYVFKTHSMDYPSAPITPVSEEELYRLSGQILGTLIILGYTTIIKIFISNCFEWKFSGILYHYNEFHPMHVIAGHTLLLNPACRKLPAS